MPRSFELDLIETPPERGNRIRVRGDTSWRAYVDHNERASPIRNEPFVDTVLLMGRDYKNTAHCRIEGMRASIRMLGTDFWYMMEKLADNEDNVGFRPIKPGSRSRRMAITATWDFVKRGTELGLKYLGPPR